MAFGNKTQRITEQSEEINRLQGVVDGLTVRLADEAAISDLATRIREELQDYERSPVLPDQALELARFAITQSEKARLTEEEASRLQDREYERHASVFRAEEGPGITEALNEQFGRDGTYEAIRARAEQDTKIRLGDEAIERQKQKVLDELSAPEVQAEMRAEAEAEVAASAEIQRFRKTTRTQREDEIRTATVRKVKEDITKEEEAREDEIRANVAEQYKSSQDAKAFRARKRQGLESEWSEKAIDEVAKQISDEELLDLLQARATRAREKIIREEKAADILKQFESTGVSTATLEEGSRLDVYLGAVVTNDIERQTKDTWGHTRRTTEQERVLKYQRKLTLSCQGDSRFVVDGDTLLQSHSAYELDNAIPRGTIITLGRKVTENGDERLEPLVVADVPLYYDDDTSTPHIVDAKLPIANIHLDGVSARAVDRQEQVH
ncbi:hypothetical protein BH23PAT1_BH23PAT1_2580 [soil metagenome]